MIYSQTFFYYFCSVLLSLFILLRLKVFFSEYFDRTYSWFIASVITFHPLAVDAFMGPNTIAGPLAFALVIEGMFFFKKDEIFYGLFFMGLGSVCNIAYSFLPIYFFIQYRKRMGEYSFIGQAYFILIAFYLYKHLLHVHHRPFIFLTYFIQNIFAPLTLNIFEFSLFTFSWSSTLFILVIALTFFVKFKIRKEEVLFFLPFIFLPCIGVLFHPWHQKYEFWHEIIFSSSSYYSIVFGVIAMFALCTPKKLFIFWGLFILGISFLWSYQWRETSGLIEIGINNLPPGFTEMVEAKRLLAWEFLYENKKERGETLLQGLARENPGHSAIQADLKFIADSKNKK